MRTGFLLITRHHLKFRLLIVFFFVCSYAGFLGRPFALLFRSERERKERVLIAFYDKYVSTNGPPSNRIHTHTRKVIGDGWNLKCSSRRAEKWRGGPSFWLLSSLESGFEIRFSFPFSVLFLLIEVSCGMPFMRIQTYTNRGEREKEGCKKRE